MASLLFTPPFGATPISQLPILTYLREDGDTEPEACQWEMTTDPLIPCRAHTGVFSDSAEDTQMTCDVGSHFLVVGFQTGALALRLCIQIPGNSSQGLLLPSASPHPGAQDPAGVGVPPTTVHEIVSSTLYRSSEQQCSTPQHIHTKG